MLKDTILQSAETAVSITRITKAVGLEGNRTE